MIAQPLQCLPFSMKEIRSEGISCEHRLTVITIYSFDFDLLVESDLYNAAVYTGTDWI